MPSFGSPTIPCTPVPCTGPEYILKHMKTPLDVRNKKLCRRRVMIDATFEQQTSRMVENKAKRRQTQRKQGEQKMKGPVKEWYGFDDHILFIQQQNIFLGNTVLPSQWLLQPDRDQNLWFLPSTSPALFHRYHKRRDGCLMIRLPIPYSSQMGGGPAGGGRVTKMKCGRSNLGIPMLTIAVLPEIK